MRVKSFRKDLTKIINKPTVKRVVEMYEQGFITLEDTLKNILNACNPKVFTFRFYFCNNGKDDATEFCAETQDEAETLFAEFQAEEGCDKWEICEVVYNPDDAAEYGERYGCPKEFKEVA